MYRAKYKIIPIVIAVTHKIKVARINFFFGEQN